jgi:hypothetical protein
MHDSTLLLKSALGSFEKHDTLSSQQPSQLFNRSLELMHHFFEGLFPFFFVFSVFLEMSY